MRLRVCKGDPRPYWPCGIEVIVPDENLSGFTSVGPGIVLGIRRGGAGLEFEVLEGPFSEKYPFAQ